MANRFAPPARSTRRVYRSIVVAAALVFLAACGQSNGDSTTKPAGATGRQALTVTFKHLDGTSGSIAALARAPVVVNFFASTCGECVTEMPDLDTVNKQAGGAVTFVGIDVGEDADTAGQFVRSVGVDWEIGLDPNASILTAVGGFTLPTTVILDAAGGIVSVHHGVVTADAIRDVLHNAGLYG